MDAEVDAALAVFLFRLGQVGEGAGNERAGLALVVLGDAIVLIRDEGEFNLIGAEETAQRLEQRSAEGRVARGIRRERRGEVRADEIAGRRAQGRKGQIANGVGIAIACTGGTGARVRLADAGDRTPEIPIVFRFPRAHAGISHRDIHQHQQSRQIDGIQPGLIRDLDSDLVVEPGRRAKAGRAVVSPKDADEGLLRCAFGGRDDAIAPEALYFVVGGRVLGAVHGRRRRTTELAGRFDDKREAFSPVSAKGQRDQADRILAPMSGEVARGMVGADARLRGFRTIA